MNSIVERLRALDGSNLGQTLDERGFAVLPELLSDAECADLVQLYDDETRFRSKIVMTRHNFGQGEYQYFHYPLPSSVAQIRNEMYPLLAPLARTWSDKLGLETNYPDSLPAFLATCKAHDQSRPTPLLLKYVAGDYNRLHQDLYGEIAFPLQLAICLNQPGEDYCGGEFVLTEQRARMQTRVEVVALGRGDGIVFANRYRPVQSVRGYARVNMRHGVSRIHSGLRYCLGVIFHDAA